MIVLPGQMVTIGKLHKEFRTIESLWSQPNGASSPTISRAGRVRNDGVFLVVTVDEATGDVLLVGQNCVGWKPAHRLFLVM